MSTARWKDHVIAVLVTVHLGMIAVNAIPSPPRMDKAALAHPEVDAELDRFFGDGPLRERAISTVQRYDRWHRRTTKITRKWLRPIGSEQGWTMFAGTPPRKPRVMLVQVRLAGSDAFAVWGDGRIWGTGEPGFDFRHRKAQNKLSIRGSKTARKAYTRWWGEEWNRQFPDRPATEVRTSYAQITTRTAARVRAGKAAPEPTILLQHTVELEAPE